MTYEKVILTDGAEYPVTISDNPETLRAAKAAGRVIVGLRRGDGSGQWLPADYVTDLTDAGEGRKTVCGLNDEAGDHGGNDWPDDGWLERVVRRTLGLPWEIARTSRLVIREFTLSDLSQVIHDPEDTGEDQIFQDAGSLEAYIHCQYAFFECGMWALIRQSDGQLIGMAGVVPEEPVKEPEKEERPENKAGAEPERVTGKNVRREGSGENAGKKPTYVLGYHIYAPYRHKGYAKEACLRILALVEEEYGGQAVAYVRPDNVPSVSLLESLGFRFHQKYSGSEKLRYRHAGN